jgi:hypothetical protein
MRTKLLIWAAALAAASACTTMAQTVYDLNVVGYINIPVVEGFNLIANQLDFDGTGVNNTPANVLGESLPVNASVYGWSPSNTWNIAAYTYNPSTGLDSWTAIPGNMPTLNPGQGVWLDIPSRGLAGTTSNLVVVGEVDQGSLVNTNLAAAGGFSLVSSIVPLSGGLQTVLGYTPMVNDTVYQWNAPDQAYLPAKSFVRPKGGGTPVWTPSEPIIGVGYSGVSEGFWLDSGAGVTWSNYFSIY